MEDQQFPPAETPSEVQPTAYVTSDAIMTAHNPLPATPSRVMRNYAVIAVTFLVIGGIIGLVASNAFVKVSDVEKVVRDVLAEPANDISTINTTLDQLVVSNAALQTALSQIPVATSNDTSAATALDPAMIQQLVAEALVQSDEAKYQKTRIKLIDDDPYMGNADAPITIVEFSAYACPYCARHFQTTFQPLLDNYGQYIRYVYRDYPVINPDVSFAASLAAQCANEQGSFWAFHNALFSNQDKLGTDFYISTAQDEGINIDQFTQCINDQKYNDEVQSDYYAGDDLNITGTPTFWINGEILSGAQPYARFERIILQKLADAGITVEKSS